MDPTTLASAVSTVLVIIVTIGGRFSAANRKQNRERRLMRTVIEDFAGHVHSINLMLRDAGLTPPDLPRSVKTYLDGADD